MIAAYRLAREAVPALQLALIGSMALDDPEGWDMYRQVREASLTDPERSCLHESDRCRQRGGQRVPTAVAGGHPEVDP